MATEIDVNVMAGKFRVLTAANNLPHSHSRPDKSRGEPRLLL